MIFCLVVSPHMPEEALNQDSKLARDLGLVIDSKLSLSAHVTTRCRSEFYDEVPTSPFAQVADAGSSH